MRGREGRRGGLLAGGVVSRWGQVDCSGVAIGGKWADIAHYRGGIGNLLKIRKEREKKGEIKY